MQLIFMEMNSSTQASLDMAWLANCLAKYDNFIASYENFPGSTLYLETVYFQFLFN